MCGISAIILKKTTQLSTNQIDYLIYKSLYYLQHRGQDSYGIVLVDKTNSLIFNYRDDLIKDDIIQGCGLYSDLKFAIGHVRYPTTKLKHINIDSAQPFTKLTSKRSYILSHNGQVSPNKTQLEYFHKHSISVSVQCFENLKSDSELILLILENEFRNYDFESGKVEIEQIKQIFYNLHKVLIGSYSAVFHVVGYGTFILKDKHGIKPLVIGENSVHYLVSSESISLTSMNYKIIGEVGPGEVVFIPDDDIENDNKNTDGYIDMIRINYLENPIVKPCIFEWIYMASVESEIYGVSVYQARLNMGRQLSETINRYFLDNKLDISKIDYIIPVPETSKPVALSIAETLHIPYREAIIKNRFVNRTFIMNTQEKRIHNIQLKFNIIGNLIKGKDIILTDDSVVRGNTLQYLVRTLKNHGAGKIWVCSASPQILHKNIYGIDIPDKKLLIAVGKTNEEIAKELGADGIIYQTLEGLEKSITDVNQKLDKFETSVFTGKYII